MLSRKGTARAKARRQQKWESKRLEGDTLDFGMEWGGGQQKAVTWALRSHWPYARDATEPLKHVGRGKHDWSACSRCGKLQAQGFIRKLLQTSRQEMVGAGLRGW